MGANPFSYPLTRALRLDTFAGKPIVALVGGGGKTSTMFALASELAAQGRRVVTTTTTRLFAAQRAQSPAWCAMDQLAALGSLLDAHGQCLVTAADDAWQDGKARGIGLEQVAALVARPDVDALLIEADGSRARPFKAPADHEPVIPPQATHVVALVGADIFGKPLASEHVHRPERVIALGGAAAGSPVTPELVAHVLAHPQGGLFHVPDAAAFLPFLNKVEGAAATRHAERAAQLLLSHERVREVLLGSLHALGAGGDQRESAIRTRGRAAAVVLAAGQGRRFGGTKQLLDWRGKPLVAHMAEVALALCETVVVVVGHEAEAVARAVAHLPVEVVLNERAAQGQGTSVAAGAAALLGAARPFIGEAFFLLADQPLVTPTLLAALREARRLAPIAVPRHGKQRGNPVLFDAALLPVLAQATGDVGGRALFEAYRDELAWLDVDDPAVLRDVDTVADWEGIQNS